MGSKERFYVDIMALQPEVTGSCNLVIVKYPNGETTRFIVDCGLFQEKEYQKYNCSFPFDGENIEFALVTHNHVDHVGRLPLLEKAGFRGEIFTSKQTEVILPLALYDSCKVLRDTAKRSHVQPLYRDSDVSAVLKMVVGCEYEQPIHVSKRITATFFKNGHLVGAALILVQISYPGYEDINILFTGDYNNKNAFFDVPNLPDWVLDLPLTLVQESTYGYVDSTEIKSVIRDNISSCMKREKTAVCLVFSLGRCQEVLYLIKCMQEDGEISPDIPIYLDGKLALRYTELYLRSDLGIKENMRDFMPKNLQYVSKEFRPQVIDDNSCKIIVTTSGMGTYGPAQAYIPAYIARRGCLIQFTGYTAEGTLGYELKEATAGGYVTLGGIMRKKYADVEYSSEMSSHAKADEMLDFLKRFRNLKLVLINHGEIDSKQIFAARIIEEIDAKNVAILGRDYLFRISPYGLIRSFSTSYR